MTMDEILFEEMKESLRRLQSRAEHFSDHDGLRVKKSSRRIMLALDEITDDMDVIERGIS